MELQKCEFIVPPQTPEKTNSLLYFYAKQLEDPKYESFLLSLTAENNYAAIKAIAILTKQYKTRTPSPEYFQIFTKKSPSYGAANQLLYFLAKTLLHSLKKGLEDVRIFLSQNDKIRETLIHYTTIHETQYRAFLIFWILSFNKSIKLTDLIPSLVKCVTERHREKVLRVVYANLKNILPSKILTLPQAYKMLKATKRHLERDIKDSDLLTDLKHASAELAHYIKSTSSIESYLHEVFGGNLESSPYHYDDHFWESNMATLQENKIELIKAMKKYLRSSNSKAVCIAANDIHMFLRVVPEAYFVVEKLGVKNDLIELALSKNEDVRFYAVQSLATCIFAEWAC